MDADERVASGSLDEGLWVFGAIMVRADEKAQAQRLADFLELTTAGISSSTR